VLYLIGIYKEYIIEREGIDGMKKKGALWRIPGTTKNYIAKYASAPENKEKSRETLANELEQQLGTQAPSLDTIKKMISKMRKTMIPIDRRWDLGSLLEHPIPPEGVAKVFDVLCQYGRPPRRPKGAWGLDISIREALWIFRLSALPLPVKVVESLAIKLAEAERIAELTGEPLATREIDEEIYEMIGYPGQKLKTEESG
jgi:hypothetical protein